ncbi:MAG: nitroreductase family protein [Thermoplasmata archaeon]|nr:nitroreductase family protein [Thermoplasmata archaeon]
MELEEAINKRQSIRFYQKKRIGNKKIEELVKAAIRAPNANGLENWFFVIYNSNEAREKIQELLIHSHIDYYREIGISNEKMDKLEKKFKEGMYSAPCYVAVFIDKNSKVLKDKKYEELEMHWAIESAAMAIENLMLKAVELGLGTCYIGVANFTYFENEIKKMAGLGKNYQLVGLISIGYPKKERKPRKRRKRLEEITKFV